MVCRPLAVVPLCALLAACCPATPAPRTVTAALPPPAQPAPLPPAEPVPAGPVPPRAEVRPHAVESPFGTRNDPYYWLRDDTRQDPAVLAYLEAENAYAREVLAPAQALEDTLFAEMRARIKEDDASVPVFEDGYWYYTRFETGKQHPIHARKKGTLDAPEQVLLDGNRLAEGHAFYKIGAYAPSRDGKRLAWAEDTVGRNQYVLRVKDLATNQLLPATATNIAPSLVWANDHQTLFYVGKDATTLREDRVIRHRLGGGHELVHHEQDAAYYVSLAAAKSRRYIVIALDATTTSEARLIDADRPASAPRVFLPRAKDHLYELDHLGTRFVVRTNEGAKNFRLVEIPAGKQASRAAWKELVPHRADVLVEGFALYQTFVGVSIRSGGLRKVRILPASKPAFELDAQDASYAMTLLDTPDPRATRVRYRYDSMTTPATVYELDVATRARTELKQQPVPGYDPSQYTSEYLHATAPDGARVPISVVYRKDTAKDGRQPLMIYGYGSYGSSLEPRLDANTVSLLDRGWVYAIAHVRGGEELGRAWYEDGKLLKKVNTFTDFIAATEALVAARLGAPGRVFAMGGSAGGLLVGVIANMRPELYRGLVSFVPFVDVVTTMLDESIPLTTNEFDEWGNPGKDADAYAYMLAYSPYDNIKAQAYPAIYVKTGLWDSQVQYFEPAKWVARLRATKTDTNPLVFETDMRAGHGGAAGRFGRLRERARAFAFVLHVDATGGAAPR
jgi:oligopeptidase B